MIGQLLSFGDSLESFDDLGVLLFVVSIRKSH